MSNESDVLVELGRIDEKLVTIFNRMDTIEGKLDTNLERDHGLETRIVELETQLKLGRWLVGGAALVAGGAMGGHFL